MKRRSEMASGGATRGEDAASMRIGVVGAGTMGGGIAQVFAQQGYGVVLVDLELPRVERALANIARHLGRQVEKGRMTDGEAHGAVARIQPGQELAMIDSCAVVVEAVVEHLETKLDVFQRLDAVCPPNAILATNTSSISITRLGAATNRPEKVIGMHFMNPVPVMPLVEVVRGLRTSEETIQVVRSLTESLGKTPVEVQDAPGFVSNRVLMPMINEAIYALMEGVAPRESIDAIMKLGMNHPLGPLQLADLVGLDVCLHVMETLHNGFGDDKYRPCPLLRRYVQAGWLGRKAGRGFYDYT